MIKMNAFSSCTISSALDNCFSKLTEKEQNLIDSNSVNIKYKKGEIICKQGSFASHIMLVKSGLVKVFLECKENVLVLKIVSQGNMIGLTSLNEENNTFQYSAQAYIDTEIQEIDINVIRKIILENPEFSKGIINILNMNNVQINSRFFCLTFKQSYGRLADIILCLSDRVFRNTEFHLPLNRKEIAELTGLSTETVVRLLKKFKEDQLIDIKNKVIRILDYEKLSLISQNG